MRNNVLLHRAIKYNVDNKKPYVCVVMYFINKTIDLRSNVNVIVKIIDIKTDTTTKLYLLEQIDDNNQKIC